MQISHITITQSCTHTLQQTRAQGSYWTRWNQKVTLLWRQPNYRLYLCPTTTRLIICKTNACFQLKPKGKSLQSCHLKTMSKQNMLVPFSDNFGKFSKSFILLCNLRYVSMLPASLTIFFMEKTQVDFQNSKPFFVLCIYIHSRGEESYLKKECTENQLRWIRSVQQIAYMFHDAHI